MCVDPFDAPIFFGIERELLKNYFRNADTEKKSQGDVVFAEGEENASLRILLDGEINLFREHTDEQGTYRSLGYRVAKPFEPLGVRSLLFEEEAERTHAVSAKVVSKKASWFSIPFEDAKRLLIENDQFKLNIARFLGRLVRQLNQQALLLAGQHVKERAIFALYNHLAGRKPSPDEIIELRWSRRTMARFLGVAEAAIHRLCKSLQHILSYEEGSYYITWKALRDNHEQLLENLSLKSEFGTDNGEFVP
ncbi:MAG: Crp/Fnr family transcriptional regulator [Deltaproteobacteria bacterium]|nr:MAG: Crp/Fnr family transcriptional regulator [Deltaproteobacteria bacterium]